MKVIKWRELRFRMLMQVRVSGNRLPQKLLDGDPYAVLDLISIPRVSLAAARSTLGEAPGYKKAEACLCGLDSMEHGKHNAARANGIATLMRLVPVTVDFRSLWFICGLLGMVVVSTGNRLLL